MNFSFFFADKLLVLSGNKVRIFLQLIKLLIECSIDFDCNFSFDFTPKGNFGFKVSKFEVFRLSITAVG